MYYNPWVRAMILSSPHTQPMGALGAGLWGDKLGDPHTITPIASIPVLLPKPKQCSSPARQVACTSTRLGRATEQGDADIHSHVLNSQLSLSPRVIYCHGISYPSFKDAQTDHPFRVIMLALTAKTPCESRSLPYDILATQNPTTRYPIHADHRHDIPSMQITAMISGPCSSLLHDILSVL